jgi:hypothetical protein
MTFADLLVPMPLKRKNYTWPYSLLMMQSYQLVNERRASRLSLFARAWHLFSVHTLLVNDVMSRVALACLEQVMMHPIMVVYSL